MITAPRLHRTILSVPGPRNETAGEKCFVVKLHNLWQSDRAKIWRGYVIFNYRVQFCGNILYANLEVAQLHTGARLWCLKYFSLLIAHHREEWRPWEERCCVVSYRMSSFSGGYCSRVTYFLAENAILIRLIGLVRSSWRYSKMLISKCVRRQFEVILQRNLRKASCVTYFHWKASTVLKQ